MTTKPPPVILSELLSQQERKQPCIPYSDDATCKTIAEVDEDHRLRGCPDVCTKGCAWVPCRKPHSV